MNLKIDTSNERDLQKLCNYSSYHRDSNFYSDKNVANNNYGSLGGTQWVCFYIKNNKSSYFDSFGGNRDKLLPN